MRSPAPIIVDGDVWGAMLAGTAPGAALPDEIEDRLAEFTELVATAISNTESRVGLARLAEEQAALWRVATLAARGTSPEELFAAVVEEAGRVLPVMNVAMVRYHPDRTMTVLAISNSLADSFPVGSRWPLGGTNVSTVVFETARSARVDDYADAAGRLSAAIRERALSSAVGAPIVEGGVWGVMTLASTERTLPVSRRASLRSRSWWRQRSRTVRVAPAWPGSPNSRRRCGAWRCSSRGVCPRRTSSQPSPRRWSDSLMRRPRRLGGSSPAGL